jgi:hypothetical protein
MRLSDEEVERVFIRLRWADNNGDAYCPLGRIDDRPNFAYSFSNSGDSAASASFTILPIARKG